MTMENGFPPELAAIYRKADRDRVNYKGLCGDRVENVVGILVVRVKQPLVF